eukprot:5995856-Amphidinium_carterae.1
MQESIARCELQGEVRALKLRLEDMSQLHALQESGLASEAASARHQLGEASQQRVACIADVRVLRQQVEDLLKDKDKSTDELRQHRSRLQESEERLRECTSSEQCLHGEMRTMQQQ